MTPNRRQFLRAAGVALALPCLDAWSLPRAEAKKRLVCLNTPLGLHPPFFFPEKAGADYAPTPYLEVMKDFRKDYSVISGLSHPGMSPGLAHQCSVSFLTGAPGAGRPGFKNTISIDQLAAESIGDKTRLRSLALTTEGGGYSWTRTGAQVPAENSPSKVFSRLFLADTPDEIKARERQLADGRSILDDVAAEAKKLQSGLGKDDREKLDEYATSVRELEKRLAKDEEWFRKPKPKVDEKPPKDNANGADVIGRMRLMLDLTALALKTDSTRLVTVGLGGSTFAPPIDGVTLGHHDLSHHGKDPAKLAQLRLVELEIMKALRDFLAKLKEAKEDGASVLDRTSVFFGSNVGDGSSHSVKNLPVFLAGGGFKHGGHLAFNPDSAPPLCNLYVSLLQKLGVQTDRFGTSTGTLTGL